jgi:hypothetical protein
MPSPPSLVEISFETVLVNIQRIPSEALETLPEQFVTELFEGVLARGMLNEPIFDTFELVAKTNERLDERIPHTQHQASASFTRENDQGMAETLTTVGTGNG